MNELRLTSYVVLVWLLFASGCLAPVEALSFEATQYARVVAQAERIAYLAAQKSSFASKVAAAAAAPSPASMAIRLVAGPIGWASLGVAAGLVIADLYYSAAQLQSVKQAAAPGNTYSIPGYTLFPVIAGGNCPSPTGACSGQWARIHTNNTCDLSVYPVWPVPAGWAFGGWETCGDGSNMIVVNGSNLATTPQTATPQQVQQYLQSLPPSDPQSIESHSGPVGQGQEPRPADAVENQTVSPSELPTTVKPKPVPTGDTIVADNVSPPAGSPTTSTQTQQTITTTTTTQNPDGSTTEHEETQATASCAAGTHESRTFGSVLQAHQALWASSPLLSALNLLKSLTWPTTLPVVSLPSVFFGSQQVDFNQWGWFFVVLRSLVIAMASLGAYRIIFVGGRT
ncbi:hypothetical protein [Nitrospira sp. Nam80]